MASSRAENLLQRWADLEQEQRKWLNAWQELADYIQPRKSNISFQHSSAQQTTDKLFDSTAAHANELLAASMQGALTSDALPWFSLRLRGVELKRDHDVNLLLEQCSRDMFDAFGQSNFASQTHELYLDAPCFGTAAVFVEEREPALNVAPGSLRFTSLAPGTFAIDEDAEGHVDTVFRKFKLSARAAAGKFGENNVGKQVQVALQKNAAQSFEFLHAVYPRTDQGLPMGRRRLPATKLRYASMWVDVQGKVVMRESGYNEAAIMVPRWTKMSGEMYGRGPGSVALPDIKTLNKAVELKLKGWAKSVDPPLKARDEGIVDGPHIENGAITYVRDMDAIDALTGAVGRLDVADMEEEKTRQAIRRMFFSDQLQLQEGPQMTAYEVQVRYELMQRILGPTLGYLVVEFLNPLIERVFWIRLRASEPNSPYRMLEAWCRQNGVVLDVEYESPLAKAQRVQDSVAMQRLFQIILPLSQFKPEIMDNFDLDYAARFQVESVGAPARLLRPEAEVKAIRDARVQAQEQQAALDTAATAAKAGGDVAPLVQALATQGTVPPGVGSPAIGRG